MTLTEQVKVIDDKIKPNKAQYDLDREAAKISALSSGGLKKYDNVTGEDLEYKPDVIQKAKFEYSPLGKVFNKGLDESEKEERLLERLKNNEGKDEKQLKAIKDQFQILTKKTDKEVDFRNLPFRDKLDSKSKKTYDDFKEKSERINSTKLVCIDFRFKTFC